jgi:hypothetical protein
VLLKRKTLKIKILKTKNKLKKKLKKILKNELKIPLQNLKKTMKIEKKL